jgi:hypothetical protein
MAYGKRYNFAASESADVEVETAVKSGEHTIVGYAVEDATAAADPPTIPPTRHATAAGTLTLWGKPLGADDYEEVYLSDGTTQATFDPTSSNQNSRIVSGAFESFKLVSASLDADCVAYLSVSSDDRG